MFRSFGSLGVVPDLSLDIAGVKRSLFLFYGDTHMARFLQRIPGQSFALNVIFIISHGWFEVQELEDFALFDIRDWPQTMAHPSTTIRSKIPVYFDIFNK